MPATILFVFILMIATLGFSSMVTYENKGALYRQATVEAFYLADGAVERGRARLLTDSGWHGSILGVAEGDGTYDLVIADTTVMAYGALTKIVGTGHVGLADRRVEVWTRTEPTAFQYAIFIAGDAEVTGNACLTGEALIVGNAHGATPMQDPHFTCDATYHEFYPATPPPVYTDPAHFPGATYYYVKGSTTAPAQARIYNRSGVDITGTADFSDVLTYASGTFRFDFGDDAEITKYFHPTTGVFHLSAPDTCVVVNFGEIPTANPPGVNGLASLEFTGNGASSIIAATLVNCRFTGATELQRLDPIHWRGSTVSFRRCTLAPVNGLGLIGYQLDCGAANNVSLGTAAYPALIYITDEVVQIGSNMGVTGCLLSLGDFHSTGGPNFTFDDGFLPRLPAYLQQGGGVGVSGTLHVIRWRETAAPAV